MWPVECRDQILYQDYDLIATHDVSDFVDEHIGKHDGIGSCDQPFR